MRAFVPLALVVVTVMPGCGRTGDPAAPPQRDWFVDRARETGLDFVHVNGMSGKLYMPEILAPGVALFDFDNDGDLDVYLVQGSALGSAQGSGLWSGSGDAPEFSDRLFRNDLTIGRGRHADASLHGRDARQRHQYARVRDGRRRRGLRQ